MRAFDPKRTLESRRIAMQTILDESLGFLEIAIGNDLEKGNILMLRCLSNIESNIENDFPEIAKEAINTAQNFWVDKTLSALELEKTRINCWQYLDKKKDTIKFGAKEYHSIRAVICLLYDSQSISDLYDGLEYFLEQLSSLLDSDLAAHDAVVSTIKSL